MENVPIVKKENYMSWDTYFMSIALLSSFRSKDIKTQNGACIIDCEKKVIGIGYNGLPRGCSDDDLQFWLDEDDNDIENSKHTYVVHAEKNAIYNSMGQDLKGATMYATLFPCAVCAQAIIQVGIKQVYFLNIKPHHEAENKAVKKMFNAAGVKLTDFNDLDVNDKSFIEQLLELKSKNY